MELRSPRPRSKLIESPALVPRQQRERVEGGPLPFEPVRVDGARLMAETHPLQECPHGAVALVAVRDHPVSALGREQSLHHCGDGLRRIATAMMCWCEGDADLESVGLRIARRRRCRAGRHRRDYGRPTAPTPPVRQVGPRPNAVLRPGSAHRRLSSPASRTDRRQPRGSRGRRRMRPRRARRAGRCRGGRCRAGSPAQPKE